MGRNNGKLLNDISIGEFINNYVLPYSHTILGDEMLTKLNNQLSHLDLDELGLPGIKRIPDDAIYKYREGEVIAVTAKGYMHKGYETHYYLRPSTVIMKEKERAGVEKNAINDYFYNMDDFSSMEVMQDENRIKGKEKYLERKRRKKNG